MIPTGVASENTKSRITPLLISVGVLKFLHIEIPNDIAAAGLCSAKPSMIFTVDEASGLNPSAIPSNMAWTVNAISKTKDYRPKPSQQRFASLISESLAASSFLSF